MIILDTATRKLRVVLNSAKVTLDCPVTVHYVDAPAYTPDSIQTLTNGVTAVDILVGLAPPNTRHVKLITFVNADTAPVVAQFIYNNAGILYPMTGRVTLQIGDTLFYTDGEGWRVMDSNGNSKGVGATGPAGAVGAQGNIGIGIPGIDGKKGDFGLPGSPGVQGTQGPQGIQGPQGNAGLAGSQGVPGIDGKPGQAGLSIPGPAGSAGPQGNTGAQGIVGPQGSSGMPGIDGKTGAMGFPIQGPKGNTGNTGATGATGVNGMPGLDGKTGPMGFTVQGANGAPGAQGIAGPAGSNGVPGVDGKTGPMGFSIQGPMGAVGPQGIQGNTGPAGRDGLTIPGLDGKVGPMGFSIPGPQGPQGIQGIQGPAGSGGGSSAPAMLMSRDGNIGMMGFPGPPGPVDGTKISALTLATSVLDADDFPVNEAGTTKRVTGTLLKAYIGDSIQNQSTADQAVGASTTAYITGSALAVPVGKLRIGSWFRYRFWVDKTAAGTIALVFLVKLGTLGTTGDTTLFTITLGVGTAAADTGWMDIWITCRGPLSASGLFIMEAIFDHNLVTTGFNNVQRQTQQTVSAVFDVTTANLILGLAVTTPALYALTFRSVYGEAKNL